MKILVLSCSTGEGHNSAAKAVGEYFEKCGIEYEIADTLSLVSPSVSQTASDIYVFTTRTSMFEFLYSAGKMVSSPKLKSPVYLTNKLYCKKLLSYIEDNGFDTVICVHLFPAEAISALKNAGKLSSCRTIFIFTDYTCIPFMEETHLDYYVMPHEHLIEECVQNGMRREKLYPIGIPVRQAFYTKQPKDQSRIECNRLIGKTMDVTKKWFLVMSGSMGYGNLKDLVSQIVSKCRDSVELLLVCGNNTKLKEDLEKDYADVASVRILGFVNYVPLLMDACDVLFTKPGGLSSTEAAAKNIPMIHTTPIPGCETRNAEFFHYHGMSYSTQDVKEQVDMALKICSEPERFGKMTRSQRENINYNACEQILDLCKR